VTLINLKRCLVSVGSPDTHPSHQVGVSRTILHEGGEEWRIEVSPHFGNDFDQAVLTGVAALLWASVQEGLSSSWETALGANGDSLGPSSPDGFSGEINRIKEYLQPSVGMELFDVRDQIEAAEGGELDIASYLTSIDTKRVTQLLAESRRKRSETMSDLPGESAKVNGNAEPRGPAHSDSPEDAGTKDESLLDPHPPKGRTQTI